MNKKIDILVTGSNGFIGTELIKYLKKFERFTIWELVRDRKKNREKNVIYIDSLKKNFNIINNLKSIDCIVHLAAIAHNKNISKKDIYKVNADSVERLAIQAIKAGVKRFIFLSSIKVYGEISGEYKFDEQSYTRPQTHYAKAKLNAENKLIKLSKNNAISYTIIRPPLVYGPGVKGNLKKLFKLLYYGIPIPIIKYKNQRSILAIDNLTSFIHKCIISENAKDNIFCLADEKDVSFVELVSLISKTNHKSIRLFKINRILLQLIFKFIRRERTFHSLYSSLRTSSDKAKNTLDWKHQISTDMAFKKYF